MPRSIPDLEAQADGLITLAYTRSLPVAFLLPDELTGGRRDKTGRILLTRLPGSQ